MVQYSNNNNEYIRDIHRTTYEKIYKVPKTIQRGRACSSASSTYSSDSIITYNIRKEIKFLKLFREGVRVLKHPAHIQVIA